MPADPYRCPVCTRPWPVRILATECCTPERRARLTARRNPTGA